MYDCPISTQLSGIELKIRDEYDKQVIRAVQKIGIDIDKEGLLEALNHDRKRYEAAYEQGWNDCKKRYEDKLKRIADEVLSEEVKQDD